MLHSAKRRGAGSVPAREPAAGDISQCLRSFIVSTLCSCSLMLAPAGPALSAADSVTIRFPASRNPEIRSAQEVLVQAWGYVREYYFDPTYNNQDWKQRLQESLDTTFKAGSREEALRAVEQLLATLGDPFTRVLLPGGASEAFAAQTQAKIISTGLVARRLAAADGPLQVAYVVPGSPAAAAGLREGDVIVAVNGRPVTAQDDPGFLKEQLRQDKEVQLKIQRSGPAAASTAYPLSRAAAGDAVASPSGSGGASRRAAIRAAALAGGGVDAQALPAATATSSSVQARGSAAAAEREAAAADGAAGEGSQAAAERGAMRGAATGPASDGPSTSYPLTSRFIDLRLQPGPVEYVPVQYAVLTKEGPAGGRGDGGWVRAGLDSGSGGGAGAPHAGAVDPQQAPVPASPLLAPLPSRVGYIRIVAFTENVAAEVEAALSALKAAGCGSWLLDVRDNPGGIVREGLAVAELLMRPGDVFAVVRDRSGAQQTERLSEDARALLEGQPVAVLVDRYSASTSELLAGALHDDARALIVGERTYGKGRTQRVVQLNGGVTLLVSTDTYVTPAGRAVDRVGLAPDVACRPGPPPLPLARPVPPSSSVDGPGADGGGGGSEGVAGAGGADVARGGIEPEQVDGLLGDACVRAAIGKLTRGTVSRGG